MDTGSQQDSHAEPPAGRASFRWPIFLAWLLGSLLHGVAVAWLAVVAGTYFHPLIIFPLLVGVGLGAITVAAMRVAQVANRRTVLLGTALAALVAVAAQHYFTYQKAWDHYHVAAQQAQSQSQALQKAPNEFAQRMMDRMPVAPGSFLDYMLAQSEEGRPIGSWRARGWMAWASWTLDGLLLAAAALALVAVSLRLPYCNRCRSWYRTTRAGPLDDATAERLAQLVGVPLRHDRRATRFRLQACTGGCGPTLLELLCERPRGGVSRRQAWLDAALRDRVTELLDQHAGTPQPSDS